MFFSTVQKKINSQLSQKVRIKISAGDTTKFCVMTSPKTSTKDCQKTGFTKTTGRPGRRQRNCSACISLRIRCHCRSTSASRERTSSTPNARCLQRAPSSVAWPSRSPCSTSWMPLHHWQVYIHTQTENCRQRSRNICMLGNVRQVLPKPPEIIGRH